MEIQNVINSITTAEMEAEEIIRLAAMKAKDIQLKAEVECDSIRKSAVAETKKTVKLIMSNADVAANTKSDVKIKEGLKEVDKQITAAKPNVKKATEYVLGRLTKKYVDC